MEEGASLLSIVADLSILIFLAFIGTVCFKKLNILMPSLLGTLTVIGGLKAFGVDLPSVPSLVSPFIQIMLGLYVGGKITRDKYSGLKKVCLPALFIIIWSLIIVFGMGFLLARITVLDTFTAIVSSSMGGLPEMTLIASETEANVSIMLLMQLVRMLSTFIFFPIIFRSKFSECSAKLADINEESFQTDREEGKGIEPQSIYRATITISSGVLGGFLFLHLGVPAGGLVGSMLFCATISFLGFKVATPPESLFLPLLAGIGLIATDDISPEIVEIFLSGHLVLPAILSILITFSTSFLVALLIQRKTDWDLLTCLLASAPAGFTVMTALALQYNKNAFNISMLHLSRLLTLKTVVPIFFTFL